MMSKRNALRILFLICLMATGCFESKVDQIRLGMLAERLATLEEWQTKTNHGIRTLQTLANALKDSLCIISVDKTDKGYTIVLSNGDTFTIRHGQQGDTGANITMVIPIISIRDSSDGHTYWTVEGRLLRDAGGQPMRANGEKGEQGEGGQQGVQGETGTIPRICINRETDEWEISTDEGKTWQQTGVSSTGRKGESGNTGTTGTTGPGGPAGETVFAQDGIHLEENYVEFTLADKDRTKIRIPRYREWNMTFPEGTALEVVLGQGIIPYIISGAGGIPTVDAGGDNGWLAEVYPDKTNPMQGKVIVTPPVKRMGGNILIILTDGLGHCRIYSIKVSTIN